MPPVLEIHPTHPQPRLLDQAVSVLRDGGIIIYPTDTVYGLGCDVSRQEAIDRIARIKGRDPHKPFSFVCAGLSEVSLYARIPDPAYRIMKRCLPGPYTFVLRGTKQIPRGLRSRQKTVGVRIPDHPVPGELISRLGRPIVSTSANRSGETVIMDPADPENSLVDEVDLVLSCGPLPVVASTVVSFTDDQAELLRAGAGDPSQFERK
jgi:tRNA threonylcarbamoyl adenosine modification protein (Sua5/YciO/YrdC/YwlC family)